MIHSLSTPSWKLGGASVLIMPRSMHRPVDTTIITKPLSHRPIHLITLSHQTPVDTVPNQLVDPLNQGTFVVVSAAWRTRGTGPGALGVLRYRFSVCNSSRSRCIRDTVSSNAATGDHSLFGRFRPAVSLCWSARSTGPSRDSSVVILGHLGW